MMTAEEENLNVYLSDAVEAVRSIEECLHSLEAEADNAAEIHRLYRAMHSIKGNAGFLELVGIERLAHACEDLVSLPRDRGMLLDPELITLLHEALDALRSLHRTLADERKPPPPELTQRLVQRLAEAFADRGGNRVGPSRAVELFDDASFGLELMTEPVAAAAAEVATATLAHSAEPHPPATPTSSRGEKAKTSHARIDFVRVDAMKVGSLMDLAGELGLACAAVTRHPNIDVAVLEDFGQAAHRLELLVRELQNDLAALRLVPVSPIFQRLKRVVEDAARRTGKEVDLILRGEETEVDRVMIDALQDPLVHALRNAVDHGLEGAEERVAAGKPARGRIVLSASYQAGEVTIDIRDDGRGLQRDRILERARSRGVCTSDVTPSDEEIFQYIFLPGFSTKTTVDSLSGRGVGMDVLKTTVENLRGRVLVRSTPGHGTRFTLKMPLTLAFVEAMVVRERDRLFALPIERVFEVSKIKSEDLIPNAADGELLLRVRDTCVPLLWLHDYWNEPRARDLELNGRLVVVVQTSTGILALPVDEIMGNQQVMLKPLRGPLQHIRAAAGCGMLRTGDVAIALDCDRLHG